MTLKFTGSFTQQSGMTNDAITAAVAVLQSGRLHRYNTAPGEISETALLEVEYAKWQGAKYCLACASGGQGMQISLRAAGILAGDKVLTNSFTLAPVPGAITAVGGIPVLVETNENLVIDLDDLAQKAKASGAKFLLLSHMRGHLVDMEKVVALSKAYGFTIIEDCAHTMGATWDGQKSGNFGLAGCFSTQTYKHINSGEGGLITSNDPEFIARAILLSGSYMLYERHDARPHRSYFEEQRLDVPNMSARMDNLRAAILRPQLRNLDNNIEAWNERYNRVADALSAVKNHIYLPQRPKQEYFVGSSIQFCLPKISADGANEFLKRTMNRGVEVKWFGAKDPLGFTSSHHNWGYIKASHLPKTDAIMAGLFDMRLPLTFSIDDCALIASILVEEIQASFA